MWGLSSCSTINSWSYYSWWTLGTYSCEKSCFYFEWRGGTLRAFPSSIIIVEFLTQGTFGSKGSSSCQRVVSTASRCVMFGLFVSFLFITAHRQFSFYRQDADNCWETILFFWFSFLFFLSLSLSLSLSLYSHRQRDESVRWTLATKSHAVGAKNSKLHGWWAERWWCKQCGDPCWWCWGQHEINDIDIYPCSRHAVNWTSPTLVEYILKLIPRYLLWEILESGARFIVLAMNFSTRLLFFFFTQHKKKTCTREKQDHLANDYIF